MYATITALSHYLPTQRRDNNYFADRLDTSAEWIEARTGIRERRVAGNKSTSDLIVIAATRCLLARGISAATLDGIIVTTMSPDCPTPSTAATVQRKLAPCRAWGFDISAACAGFVYGLTVAARMIESGCVSRILLCCGEKMSSIVDPQDRSTAILFGDGAAAILVERTDDFSIAIQDCLLGLDGSGESELQIPAGGSRCPTTRDTVDAGLHFLKQNGPAVFRAAVAGMERVTRELLERNGLSIDDVDLFVPHQANGRIIDAVSTGLGIAPCRVASTIDLYGNTASASIPISLSEWSIRHQLNQGDTVVVTAFGAGFTMGSILIKWGNIITAL